MYTVCVKQLPHPCRYGIGGGGGYYVALIAPDGRQLDVRADRNELPFSARNRGHLEGLLEEEFPDPQFAQQAASRVADGIGRQRCRVAE